MENKVKLTPTAEEEYKRVEADYACPKCKAKAKITLRPCINVTLHPEEKESVVNGSFFTHTCKECGEISRILYPCLYDDMEHLLMVYLLPDDSQTALSSVNQEQKNWSPMMQKAAKACTMRAVRTENELKEKIKISDAKKDDRFVELTKAFVYAQVLKQKPEYRPVEVLFERQGDEDGFLFFDADAKASFVAIPEGLYEEVERMFAGKAKTVDSGLYSIVDAAWACEILKDIS
ncbi:MAG TPA: CpXC domain-containing protein [Bacillota bacterium]|nr:CpXC domain-containing protein [Bacillota bacterium]HPE38342.1 CpXC domain-containing protein [Bacillota bacterium]